MKVTPFALFVALLMVGCGQDAIDIVDGLKLEKRNGVMYLPNEKTPFTGRAEESYNGHKLSEGNYKEGKLHGLVTTWYVNGRKKEEEINYKNGEYDGLWTSWNENGKKMWARNWKYGRLNGVSTRWDENGQKSDKINFKDGEEDGLWIQYNLDGTESRRFTYKDGEIVDD